MISKVSIAKSKNRYDTVKKAIELIKVDFESKIRKAKRILIKPNFVSVYNQLASTHKESVKALLDIITKINSSKIMIAECSAIGNAEEGFKNYGYLELKKEYNIEFVDLKDDEFKLFEIFDERFNKIKVKISKTILKSDFRISICPMKTHDTVIVTLSIKNMAVGSIIENKWLIHQGYKAINLNIFKIAEITMPDLAVIDGYIAMEGNGPVNGSPKKLGVAVASTNPIAADWVSTKIMGFDPKNVGYLFYLWKKYKPKIKIIGENIEKIKTKFTPHSTYKKQLEWKIDERVLKMLNIMD